MDYFNNSQIFFDGNEIHRILLLVLKAQSLFQNEENDVVLPALDRLAELTSWKIKMPDTPKDEQRRVSFIKSIFDVFESKLLELEKILTQ